MLRCSREQGPSQGNERRQSLRWAQVGDIAKRAATPQLDNAQGDEIGCVRRGRRAGGKREPLTGRVHHDRAWQDLGGHDREFGRDWPGALFT